MNQPFDLGLIAGYFNLFQHQQMTRHFEMWQHLPKGWYNPKHAMLIGGLR